MAGRSLFSVFFRKSNEPTAVAQPAKAEDIEEDTNAAETKEVIEASVEVGGAKGWTTSATALLYHKISGTICVGTEGGAVHVYGDGFQFVRPWLTDDPNEVVAIIPLYPNKILVVFDDNSVVAMELPSLEVVDLLSSSWLPRTFGDITAIHCDFISEKNFVYLGTSEGVFIVLDVMESMIRVCEFQLSKADFGLALKEVSISDIQVCPKDDRFVAVGFEGGDLEEGHVVIYDFVKHKVHKSFTLPSISAMAWHHGGEFLYVASRNGQLFIINVEKGTWMKVWTAENEVICCDEEDMFTSVTIRRLSWLAPQKDDDDDDGCLFLLLANNGPDNDSLQNVILGFSLNATQTDISTVFALPPIQGEKIINFHVVPTYNKDIKGAQRSESDTGLTSPGLILLTQRQKEVDTSQFERNLKIIRCPTTPISQWGLEIGTSSEPRRATEVQPTASDVAVVCAVTPKHDNPMSLGTALIVGSGSAEEQVVSTAASFSTSASDNSKSAATNTGDASERDHRARSSSKRLSYRAFLDNIGEMDAHLSALDDWEMVMVNGEHNEVVDRAGSIRKQDLVLIGQKDGSIIAFGVSLPAEGREIGRGGIWLPLAAFRCGMTEVTALHADEECGLIAAGDEAGYFVLYQVHDEDHRVGAVDILYRLHDKLKLDIELLTSDATTVLSLEDFKEDQSLKELESLSRGLQFSKVKEVFRTRISGHVTAVSVVGEFLLCFVGTEDGTILVNSDLRSSMFAKVENVSNSGASGSVKGFHFGYFVHNDILLAVMYACFESGHVVVIDISTMSVISFNVSLRLATMENNEDSHLFDGNIDTMCVLTQNDGGQVQVSRKPTLSAHLYWQARRSMDRSLSLGSTSSDSSIAQQSQVSASSNKADVSPKPSNSRLSFFARKATATGSTSPTPPSAASANNSVAPPVPLSSEESPVGSTSYLKFESCHFPRQLVFLHGNMLCSFALDKFFAIKRKESFSTLAKGVSGVTVKKVTNQKIVASQLIKLFTDDPSEYYSYMGCFDTSGTYRLISLQSRTVVNVSSLLEGIAEESTVSVFSGAMLPSGINYIVNEGSIVYSSHITFSDCHVASSPPDRANPTSRSVHKSLTLLHGREAMLAKAKNDVKKRRSSVMSLTTSAPTDLYKIFAKSRDQRLTDNLFGSSDQSAMAADDNAARRSAKAANKMTNDLAQVRENFIERGERINRLALKMDDFKDTAAHYKQTAAAHKERLKQKNRTWGLF